jgi:hypothetical protein
VQGRRGKSACVAALLATVGLLLVAPPVRGAQDCGQGITKAWRGMWEVTVDYIDRESGALLASDTSTAAICPGMPIKPSLLNTLLSCSGSGGDRGLEVSCRAKYSPRRGCNAFADLDFESNLSGDAWNGFGHWTAKVVGSCEHLELGEDFVVSGRRLSRQAACASAGPSLVERFFRHGALIPVLGKGATK